MPNIYFIRAAIEDALNIRLTVEETADYLVSEGMLTRKKADSLIFKGYKIFYPDDPMLNDDDKEPDLVEMVNSNL